MRYADGGGLTARERAIRERVRLQAAEMFEQQLPTGEISTRLRVSSKSVCAWRRAWTAGGRAGLASRGPGGAECKLDDAQLDRLAASWIGARPRRRGPVGRLTSGGRWPGWPR